MELKLKLTMKAKVLVTQSCLTVCNPMDWGLPWDPGILHARTLEQVAIPFSRDLPKPGIEPRSSALQADSLPSEPPEKPNTHTYIRTCQQGNP